MTTPTATAPAAYENPLIPNARLRQMYLAMLRALMLEKALPARRRASTVSALSHAVTLSSLEACLVATSVDLRSDDLISDAVDGGTVDFLRGTGLAEVLALSGRRRPMTADCGAAIRLAGNKGIAERLWIAAGAAAGQAAIASAAVLTSPERKAAKESAVVLAYVRPGEASPSLWRKVLAAAAESDLPIVFVAMPHPRSTDYPKAGSLSALASRCRVPGIAVDGKDAVALYRVAQECIGRARMGGGPTLIECGHFALHTAARSRQRSPDAVESLAQYMLHRKVCTQGWLDDSAKKFASHLPHSGR